MLRPLVRTTFTYWLFLMIIQIFYWCLGPKINVICYIAPSCLNELDFILNLKRRTGLLNCSPPQLRRLWHVILVQYYNISDLQNCALKLTWLLSTESIHGLSRNPNVGITPFFPLLPQNALLQANANQAGISMHIFQSLSFWRSVDQQLLLIMELYDYETFYFS